MTQSKHTPGPWIVEKWGPFNGEEITQVSAFYAPGNRSMQVVVDSANNEANARLIAAAPTYHDGAEAFIAYEDAIKRGDDTEAMLHYAEAARLLRLAMNQATGTSND